MYNVFARIPSLSLASLALLTPYEYAVGLLNPEPPRILIIGGVEAPEGRYPYAVSLKDENGTHFCGGSLIANDVVLTAAHCIYLDMNFTVVIGRYNLTNINVGDDVTIAEKVPHPNYNMRISEDYDFGLVFLSRPTTVDVDIAPINANNSVPAIGAAVTYLGWGEIDSDVSTLNCSQTLREVESNIITNEQCEASAGIVDGTKSTDSYEDLITENMLCTFAIDKDSCQKDSGGPLIIRGKDASGDVQVGIASWGVSCASDIFPGVAARISSVHNWIEDTVCSKSIEPGPAFKCAHTTLLEIDMSDLANTSEGYTASSVATNSQSTNTALGIVMFALANYMMGSI